MKSLIIVLIMLIVSVAGCMAQEGGSFWVNYDKFILDPETEEYKHFHNGRTDIHINLWDGVVRWGSTDGRAEPYTCKQAYTRPDGAKVAVCTHDNNKNKTITLHFDTKTGLTMGGVKIWRVYDSERKIYRIVRTEFDVLRK